MTVYEHCIHEAERSETCARTTPTNAVMKLHMKDAVQWRERAGRLSIENASKDMDDPATVLSEILKE